MFSLLFDCSFFEISATTSAINALLFPVLLFGFIFWTICQFVFTEIKVNLPETNSSVVGGLSLVFESSIDKQFKDKIPPGLANFEVVSQEFRTELYDTEMTHLKTLGVCKVRDYCRKYGIPGYSTPYKKCRLDGLVEF